MTHPEIKVSRVSLFLRVNGTRIKTENADFITFLHASQSVLVRVPD